MAATPKCKIHYFDTPGRAEIVRQMFIYLGKEFDDVRFTRDEWVCTCKAQAPLGMAPFLEEGEFKLGGSTAMSRYLAEKYKLAGSNAMENAQLESYVDAIFDIGSKIYGIAMGPEDQRETCKQDFLKNVPGRLACLEKQVKCEKNFLAEKRLTWADFGLSSLHYSLCHFGLGAVFNDCPKLVAVATNISEMDKIKEYRIKTYPK